MSNEYENAWTALKNDIKNNVWENGTQKQREGMAAAFFAVGANRSETQPPAHVYADEHNKLVFSMNEPSLNYNRIYGTGMSRGEQAEQVLLSGMRQEDSQNFDYKI